MSTPSKKTSKWDAEMDRDLYAACLVIVGEPKGPTLGKAVELLREIKGVTYTVKAAMHRMYSVTTSSLSFLFPSFPF